MLTERASLFIIVFTAINIVACIWLMWWTARTRPADAATPGQLPTDGPGTTGHVWDGDLAELNNPLPRWWLGLFIITIVFGAGYLTLYPGLGNFLGTKRWSQVGQYDAQITQARAQLDQRLAGVKDKPLAELARDADFMATARNLFGANCSTCHGSDARGARGFPNLTDRDWLWGGDEETIYQTIAQGRTGAMPALGTLLGPNGVNEVAAYVVSLSGVTAPADWIEAGRTRFETICAACHGADGKGNQMLGAPDLTDNAWLHGGDFNSVRATITNGRNNQMPAHLEMLGEAKVRLLAAYVLSLSDSERLQARHDRQPDRQAQPTAAVNSAAAAPLTSTSAHGAAIK
ncbi:MAG: cytochrome-c oxidase, cbb3-type subunit III [Pseudomonadota bacterium]|nr:cytochrome-c oxidase, cbb3-type subunit III [Pseudomonadota bacterium]